MIGTGRILLLDGAGADALADESRFSVVDAPTLDDALYELAAGQVDCVVVSKADAETDHPFCQAAAERDGVRVVLVGDVDPEADLPVAFDAAVRPDECATELPARLEALLDAGIDMSGDPRPAGESRSFDVSVEDGTVVDVSESVTRVLGYEPSSMIGEPVASFVHEDDFDAIAAADGAGAAADDPIVRFRHRDEYWRKAYVDVAAGDGDSWRVSSRTPVDVHGDYDAAEILSVLVEHVPIHLFVKDEEGRHLFVSDFVEDQPGRALGRRDIDFDWGEFGRRAYRDDMEVIETGTPIINKEEYVDFEDEWNLTSKVPWVDADGTVRGLVGVSRRITTRKEYQRELERQKQRLEQFASILSHDLRNPVDVAASHLELARDADDPSPHFDAIENALDRMTDITDDVLTMTRGGQRVEETEPLSLSTVAREAWDMVSTTDATLEVTDLTIHAEPDRLPHLFENLFRNVVDHADGPVSVRVGPLEADEGFYVADDGPGVPESDRDEIFEAGFTTKADGTGLGLLIARQVAHAHEWTIECTESRDGGARFEVAGVDTGD